MPEKKTKVKLGLKNLAMLPIYFDYVFVHLRQKARFRTELGPKFLSTLGPNPNPTRKAGRAYNSGLICVALRCFASIVNAPLAITKAWYGMENGMERKFWYG